MSLFRRPPAQDSVKLGRTHAVTAEIHYSSGTDHWWYHGQLWTTETRPAREAEFNPVLTDPRNRPVIEALKTKGRTEEEVAKECKVEPWVVRNVRRALQTADTPHLLRFYGLVKARKEEERILVTIDQDLFHEAPMVSYTRTQKGAKRLQQAMMVAMCIVDAIFIFAMLELVQIGPAIAYDPAQVSNLVLQFAEIIAFPTCMLAIYVIMARKTLVFDMEIQPVVESLLDTHTETVYLVNSEKSPASTYIARILRLSPNAIRDLTEEVARFASDTIAQLQSYNESTRDQLNSAKNLGLAHWMQSLDMDIMGRGGIGSSGETNWTAVALVGFFLVAVAVVGTWAALTAGI